MKSKFRGFVFNLAYPEKNKRITPSDSSIGNRLLKFMTTPNNFIDLITEDGKTYECYSSIFHINR